MKKNSILFTLAFVSFSAISQTNTYPFPASGNVGIGTVTPNYTLDVNGTGNFSGALTGTSATFNTNGTTSLSIKNSSLGGNTSSGTTGLYLGDAGSGINVLTREKQTINTTATVFYHEYGYSVPETSAYFDHSNAKLYTSGITRFIIDASGNIGIGTMFPSEKLSVNGNIRSKKLIVTQTGWSDYVFDSSYQLKPLSEIEQFIKSNKHLPDVPSAREVEKDGIDVGDNQAVLLKKIEELTLYMIKQQKQIEEQQKRINNLEIENIKNLK